MRHRDEVATHDCPVPQASSKQRRRMSAPSPFSHQLSPPLISVCSRPFRCRSPLQRRPPGHDHPRLHGVRGRPFPMIWDMPHSTAVPPSHTCDGPRQKAHTSTAATEAKQGSAVRVRGCCCVDEGVAGSRAGPSRNTPWALRAPWNYVWPFF